MSLRTSASLIVLLALAGAASAAPPQWIWATPDAATKAPAGECAFRRTFELADPEAGELEISADNRYELLINGRSAGSGESWNQRTKYDLTPLLVKGRNVIAVRAKNDGVDPAGLAVRAVVKSKGAAAGEIVTDATWKASLKPAGRWTQAKYDDASWEPAHVLGEYGKIAPWGAAGPVVAAATSLVLNGTRSQEKGLFELRDGDRVVFLGGTFIERLQEDGFLETALTAALPDKNITYRNVGWSGDTVWGDSRGVFGGRADGFKRLVGDVTLCKPTVLVICYGQNEAYAGEEGIDDFQQGLNQLLDALEPTGARIVLLSPPPREAVGPAARSAAKYNTEVRAYCDVLRDTAGVRGHSYADLNAALAEPMQKAVAAGKPLTEDGQHFDEAGSRVAAAAVAKLLSGRVSPWSVEIDLKRQTLDAEGTAISDLKRTPRGIEFVAADRQLPGTLFAASLKVSGLAPGTYALQVDGKPVGEAYVNGDEAKLNFVPDSRAAALRAAIGEKNQLFFHRHRPQNETYLFLFRKHEQGNNAVEIPQFDPLIEAKEKQISELRQPAKQKYELVKVK